MSEERSKREKAESSDQGVRFDVVKFSAEVAPDQLAKLRELGFTIRSANLIPGQIGPKADIVCVSGC